MATRKTAKTEEKTPVPEAKRPRGRPRKVYPPGQSPEELRKARAAEARAAKALADLVRGAAPVAPKRPPGRPRESAGECSQAEMREKWREARKTLAISDFNEDGELYQPVPSDCSPVDYMLGIMRGLYRPVDVRLRAAQSVAPYVHPKSEADKEKEPTGKKEQAAKAAREASTGKYAPGRPPLKAVA